MSDPQHVTVCTTCGRGTWHTTEGQSCRFSVSTFCDCCGQRTGEKPCNGTLRLIDRSALAPQFAPYLHTGQRIRVRSKTGFVRTGYVGKTSGWRPSYLLLPLMRSFGSADLLDHDDQVIAVREGDRYRQLVPA